MKPRFLWGNKSQWDQNLCMVYIGFPVREYIYKDLQRGY